MVKFFLVHGALHSYKKEAILKRTQYQEFTFSAQFFITEMNNQKYVYLIYCFLKRGVHS